MWSDSGQGVGAQTQSTAVVRYLARAHGLYGENDGEANVIDELAGGLRDYLHMVTDLPFATPAQLPTDVAAVQVPCHRTERE
jgi:hypothetical protein